MTAPVPSCRGGGDARTGGERGRESGGECGSGARTGAERGGERCRECGGQRSGEGDEVPSSHTSLSDRREVGAHTPPRPPELEAAGGGDSGGEPGLIVLRREQLERRRRRLGDDSDDSSGLHAPSPVSSLLSPLPGLLTSFLSARPAIAGMLRPPPLRPLCHRCFAPPLCRRRASRNRWHLTGEREREG
uniref:Uncharacterized protein n=1 Tax=Oryza sativa subsp. japonica TaxID=39947 RepID=Q69VP8_ORYSJ|nr:hypothetical protein [Oryza sativa Japonica Group]